MFDAGMVSQSAPSYPETSMFELFRPSRACLPARPVLLFAVWLASLAGILPVAFASDEMQNSLPVFPGAEGFGTTTRAGRGGQVIAVTSLADDGPGTLRAALATAGPRIIVFRVGGVIVLRDKLFIREPFVTVAGQTAPGDGITVRDFGLVIATNDVLIQHLRVRPGNHGDIDAAANDAIEMLGNRDNDDVAGAYNVVLDHVSASWAEDEVVSTWFGAHDITISWSIISEGLNRSRHSKGDHSSGLVIGGYSDRVSVHHTLLANNHSRNPLYKHGGTHEFADNLVYNWGALATDALESKPQAFINILRNVYQPGPATYLRQEIVVEREDRDGPPQLYVFGNFGPNIRAPRDNPWAGVFVDFSMEQAPLHYRAAQAFVTPLARDSGGEPDPAVILAQAGARLPRRDAIDTRLVDEIHAGAGRIIDSPEQVGGYPPYASGDAAADDDGDGMADAWEQQVGLNPADADDGKRDRNGDGYTNVEEYLYSLAP